MSTVHSTLDVPVASRIEYWQHIIDNAVLPLRGRHDAAAFRAQLLIGDIGPVRVVEATTPQGKCFRSPKLIRRCNREVYEVDVIDRGQVVVEQDGRQARLEAGDLAFVDPARPVRYTSTASTHVSLLFPRTLLPLRHDDLARLTAVRVPGDRGAGALVSSLARQLPRHLDDHDGGAAVRLGTGVVDLLGSALAARLDADLPADARQRALLRQIYGYVDTHLADRELSPASIAAAHHISLRYLHRLFESERTTVASWIRQRRLDRCRRDLLDPSQRDSPVAAIAARWGLAEPAHFNRSFKAEYGMPPAEYRDVLAAPN
jgi:AraC-like DNA-binding protein